MTKRQYFGFTFLTCGLAALVSVACSSSDDSDNPLASNGTGGAAPVTGSGGAAPVTGSGGAAPGTGSGGTTTVPDSGTSTGGVVDTTPPPAGSTYTVGESGFVTSGPWTGYAWTGVEEPTVGSTVVPASYEGTPAGTVLCASGSVAPDPDYGGVAMLGINVGQPVEGGEGSEGIWPATGAGIEYAVTNTAASPLRIQIQGALGYPDEAWCANAREATGQIAWTDFNKKCWDNSGEYYDGTVPLQAVMFLVPGDDSDPVPYDFCISSIGIYN